MGVVFRKELIPVKRVVVCPQNKIFLVNRLDKSFKQMTDPFDRLRLLKTILQGVKTIEAGAQFFAPRSANPLKLPCSSSREKNPALIPLI